MAENPFPSTEMVERATGRLARVRLSTNENEYGTAPGVVRAIADAAIEANRYADCDHYAVRRALAARFGVTEAHLRVGSGIDGLIGETARALLGAGRVGVTTLGTYPTFRYFAQSLGTTLHQVPYRDARPDVDVLVETARRERADVVYVAEPDNPTGGALGRARLLALADALPPTTLLVVDGAYAEYQDPADRLNSADVIGHRMLWLRTFSKAYALAGMRVGYGLADPAIHDRLAEGAEHYVVGRLADVAALAALDAVDHLDYVVADTAAGREHYRSELTALGYPVLPSTTNFLAFRTPGDDAADALAEHLAAHGVLVRRLAVPGLTDAIRLTVGPRAQRAEVLDLIRKATAAA